MVRQLRSLSLLLAATALCSSGLIYEDVSQLPVLNGYDYVVVGGGTAGAVVANRLTEDKDVKVLVLEGGSTNRGKPEVTIPYLIREALGDPSLDWNTTYIPQPGLLNRTVGFTRGYVLGGSSSINGMVYSRGTSEDYDRYANVSGDDGWSWNALQKYFKKSESFHNLVDKLNTTGHYDPKTHGTKGPLGTSVNAWPMDTDPILTKITQDSPEEYPFDLDFNDGTANGIGWAQYTIGNGTRSSSAWAYLADEYVNRSNLVVLTGATVRRVLQTKKGGPIDSVEFFQSQGNGTLLYTNVTSEIILSAGTVGSTQILLNSGIGDKQALESINIPSVIDLPAVGQNLSEQTLVPNTKWMTTSTDDFQHILDSNAAAAAASAQWNASHTGPFAAGGINQFLWQRLNESDPEVQKMIKQYGDPAAGPKSPHWEITPSNGRPGQPALMDVSPIGLNPYSRGSLKLNGSDPFGQPILDGGFYSHPMDMFIQKQAILAAIRLAAQPAFEGYIVQPGPELSTVFKNGIVDDGLLETFIRNNTVSNIHAVGTNSMSPRGADWGVVDPDCKVKGAQGLRVIDASIFPFVAAGHMQVPIYVFAERASDLIKHEAASKKHHGY